MISFRRINVHIGNVKRNGSNLLREHARCWRHDGVANGICWLQAQNIPAETATLNRPLIKVDKMKPNDNEYEIMDKH